MPTTPPSDSNNGRHDMMCRNTPRWWLLSSFKEPITRWKRGKHSSEDWRLESWPIAKGARSQAPTRYRQTARWPHHKTKPMLVKSADPANGDDVDDADEDTDNDDDADADDEDGVDYDVADGNDKSLSKVTRRNGGDCWHAE